MRQWTITVAVEDHDDGAAFTEGMMEAFVRLVHYLGEDVPYFVASLKDTHGDWILGFEDAASALSEGKTMASIGVCEHCGDPIAKRDSDNAWVDVNGLRSCAPYAEHHELRFPASSLAGD